MSEHPAVAFLLAAHQRAEELARAALDQLAVLLNGSDSAAVGRWYVATRRATGTFVQARDQHGRETEVCPTYGGSFAEHIALHDPASVLRRVAAERKILAEHGGVPGVCRVCAGPEWSSDDADGNREWSRSAEYWPCRTVLLLAEAWGWTEDVPC